MSLPIVTKARVVNKSIKEGTSRDGKPVTYYNLKLADTVSFDSQQVGVPEEIYNQVEEGQDIKLVGKCGGLKDKYWYFNALQK